MPGERRGLRYACPRCGSIDVAGYNGHMLCCLDCGMTWMKPW